MAVHVGVIGAGRIGRLHAENLATRIPGATVLAVADVAQAAAEQTAAQLHIPMASADYHDILNHPDIQAVVICSSTDTHSQIASEAAKAGKHIFCEKPIDHNLKKIDGVLADVKNAGVKFQVGFNRRFDPNYARVRQAVTSGEIGEPHILHIMSRDPAPPPIEYVRVSGGLFLDMMIHDFDMARFLIGSEVDSVYTLAGVRVDPKIGEAGDVDTAIVTLKFANGVIGTIDNSRKAVYGYDQRVEVFGSGGAASSSNNYPNNVTLSTGNTIYRDLPLNFFIERYTDSYVIELQAFIDAVVNDKPVPVDGMDGRVPVVMGLAARKSYEEGRPVRLSEIG